MKLKKLYSDMADVLEEQNPRRLELACYGS